MKRKRKFGMHKLLSLLLFAMAFIMGADSGILMAADGFANGAATPSPDSAGENTQLGGTPASATSVSQSEINRREIDDYIMKFRPWEFPASSDIWKYSRKKTVNDMEVYYPVSGAAQLDCVLQTATSAANSTVKFTVDTHISGNDLRMFAPYSTVIVHGVDGYEQTGSDNHLNVNGLLMLKVVDRDATSCTLKAVNGLWSSASYPCSIPALPAGTQLSVMAVAATESQLEVSPENYQPILKRVLLQKQLANIVLTDEFKKKLKEVKFFAEDIKDDALYNFRRKAERTLWFGQEKIELEFVSEKMGYENVYYTKGIMWQLLNKYAISSEGLTFKDISHVNRMQHTKNALGNKSKAYCGSGFMEMLTNIDYTKIKFVNFSTTETDFGVIVSKYTDIFGSIEFEKCPILDDMGFSNCAAVIDVWNSTLYDKVNDKETHVDMKNGGGPGGEVREASRDIVVKINGFTLQGTNSILVGPTNEIFNIDTVNANKTDINTFTWETGSQKTLNPDTTAENSIFYGGTVTLSDGDLYYLEKYDSYSKFGAGEIVQFNASSKTWTKYSGEITAGL